MVSGVAYFLLLDWPANTKDLTAVEKEILKTKMKDDGEQARMDILTHSAMRSIARDWKIYVGSVNGYQKYEHDTDGCFLVRYNTAASRSRGPLSVSSCPPSSRSSAIHRQWLKPLPFPCGLLVLLSP